MLPISVAVLSIPGFEMYANFEPSTANLGAGGARGICIFVNHRLKATAISIAAAPGGL